MAKINAPNGLFTGATYFTRRSAHAPGLLETTPMAPSRAACADGDVRAGYPLPGCDVGFQTAFAE